MEMVKLGTKDCEEATDFLDLVFSKAYGPSSFRDMLPLCYQPDDEHMRHNFAVREDGKIRAIVGLFPAKIQIEDEILTIGGIGGVSSHPNDRGKGWMKLLMNECLNEMRANHIELSFLIGLRQRYRYFGYEKAGTLLHYKLSETYIRHCCKEQICDISFTPIKAEDTTYLEKAKLLHDEQPIHCVRPISDFYLYLLSNSNQPWAALYPNGKMAGYLVTNHKMNRITEIFAEDDEVFEKMIYSWFSQQKVRTSDIFLAPWQESYARYLTSIAESYGLEDNGNWQIFNWEKVIKTLLAAKSKYQRLCEGSIIIGIKGYGNLRIDVENGTADCTICDTAANVEWDSFTAEQLMLGHFPYEFVSQLPEKYRIIMQSWFPLPLCWPLQNYV